MSPRRSSQYVRSTWTVSAVPSACRMMLLCSKVSASSSVSWPASMSWFDQRLVARDLHQLRRRAGCSRASRRPGRRTGSRPRGPRPSPSSPSRAACGRPWLPGRCGGPPPRWRGTRRRASSSRLTDVLLVETLDHPLVDDVDGELARDLAGGRAPHPVAHGEEVAEGADGREAVRLEQPARALGQVGHEEVVLVVLADLADVRPRKELDCDLTAARGGSRAAAAASRRPVGGRGDGRGGIRPPRSWRARPRAAPLRRSCRRPRRGPVSG